MEPDPKPIQSGKLKKPPLFKSGCLVFKSSGHALINPVDSKYYRCILDCKGECGSKGEKQNNKESFERNFCRYAKGFKVDFAKADAVFVKEFKKNLCELIMAEDDIEPAEDILQITLALMKQGHMNIKTEMEREVYKKTGKFPGGGKIQKEDIQDFQKAFIQTVKNDYPAWLFGYLFGTLKAFATPEKERDMAIALSMLAKHIYLTDDGKIIEIELERWGWYILNFIDKRIPGYLFGLSSNGIKVLNGKDEINSLKPLEALKLIRAELPESFDSRGSEMLSKLFSLVIRLAKRLASGDTEKFQKDLLLAFAALAYDPAIRMNAVLSPLISQLPPSDFLSTESKIVL